MSVPLLIAWCSAPPSDNPSDLPTRARPVQRVQDSHDSPGEARPKVLSLNNERVLFERIVRDDDDAFEEVYLALYSPLRSFAFALVQDDSAAHDIVQDVFLSFWRDRTRIERRDRFIPYLYKAVRNQATKARRHDRIVRDTESTPEILGKIPGMGSSILSADRVVENEELHTALIHAVDQLPQLQRATVTLLITQALNASEIAAVLGTSVAAVHMSLSRARTTLKTVLEKYRR